MCKHVVFENVAGGEGLAAGATCVGTLISMGALVLDACRIVGKASSAILAGEWSLSSVLTHVPFQLRSCAKAFLTNSKNNWMCMKIWNYLLINNLLALEILFAAMTTTVQLESHAPLNVIATLIANVYTTGSSATWIIGFDLRLWW